MPGVQKTLQTVALPEAFLDRMEVAVAGQALDGTNVGTVGLRSQHHARLGGGAVDDHGAGPAVAGFTADMGSREVELVS